MRYPHLRLALVALEGRRPPGPHRVRHWPSTSGWARHSSRGEPRLDLPKAIESVTHVVAAVVHPSSATPLGVVPAAESQAVGDATPTRERSSRAIAAMDGHNCPLRYQCARRIAVTAVISDTNRKQGKQAFAVYR